MKAIWILIGIVGLALITALLFGEEQPLFKSDNKADAENFRYLFQKLSDHRHIGSESSLFFNLTPDANVTYDVGNSSRVWANVYTGAVRISTGASVPTLDSKGIVLYSTVSVVGNAEAFVLDGSGNSTLYSPHNAKGEWIFYSYNTRTGKYYYVNMEKLIAVIERLSGETLHYEKRGHNER